MQVDAVADHIVPLTEFLRPKDGSPVARELALHFQNHLFDDVPGGHDPFSGAVLIEHGGNFAAQQNERHHEEQGDVLAFCSEKRRD